MLEDALADRYARALSALAQETNQIDRIAREVLMLADILSSGSGDISIPELTVLLGAPRIALEDKIHITDVMLEKLDFSTEVGNLLNVLISKNRVSLAPRIAKAYCARVASMKNIAIIEVESAQSLKDSDLADLREVLEEVTGKAVDVSLKINRDLIAGLRLHVGGTRLDGSVEGSLEQLQRALEG